MAQDQDVNPNVVFQRAWGTLRKEQDVKTPEKSTEE